MNTSLHVSCRKDISHISLGFICTCTNFTFSTPHWSELLFPETLTAKRESVFPMVTRGNKSGKWKWVIVNRRHRKKYSIKTSPILLSRNGQWIRLHQTWQQPIAMSPITEHQLSSCKWGPGPIQTNTCSYRHWLNSAFSAQPGKRC